MPLPLAEFQSRLLDSGILNTDHVSTLETLLASNSAPASGDDLARLLVNRKILTAYQAQAIYQGKGKQLVLGNYLVLDKLGQGGMGLVLKARGWPRLLATWEDKRHSRNLRPYQPASPLESSR